MIDMAILRNKSTQLSLHLKKIIVYIVQISMQQESIMVGKKPNAIMKTALKRQTKKIMHQHGLCLTKVILLRSELMKIKGRQSSTFLKQNDLISLVKICTLRNTTNLSINLKISIREHTSQTSVLCHHLLALSWKIVSVLKTSIFRKLKWNKRGTT